MRKDKKDLNFEIKSSSELIEMLSGLIMEVRRGDVDCRKALTIAKVADNINRGIANELEYNKNRCNNKKIKFFEN